MRRKNKLLNQIRELENEKKCLEEKLGLLVVVEIEPTEASQTKRKRTDSKCNKFFQFTGKYRSWAYMNSSKFKHLILLSHIPNFPCECPSECNFEKIRINR